MQVPLQRAVALLCPEHRVAKRVADSIAEYEEEVKRRTPERVHTL